MRLASRHPETLKTLLDSQGTRTSTGTPEEAARFGNVVMLAVPLRAVPELALALAPLLEGRIVIDTSNACGTRDGA